MNQRVLAYVALFGGILAMGFSPIFVSLAHVNGLAVTLYRTSIAASVLLVPFLLPRANRLGTHSGGGAHTYSNTSATNYGVNRAEDGTLSGYAWGTNVGWIRFDPAHGGVTIDPASGSFDGFAWGENVGWIHFKNTNPAYIVAIEIYQMYLPLVVRNGQ